MDENRIIEVLDEFDDFFVDFSVKHNDINLTNMTALILSRLVLINEYMETTDEFNQLLQHILNRTETNRNLH
jgi:cell fate (sporulation/competence/biofilm development) regulator YmcA (YheA/YmcA/DUF963 family)